MKNVKYIIILAITLFLEGCDQPINGQDATNKPVIETQATQSMETPICTNAESPNVSAVPDSMEGLPEESYRSSLVATDGEYHYFFVDPYSTNKESFYKSNVDGSNICIIDDESPSYININKNSIYFVKTSNYSWEGPIIRIDKNGSSRAIIYSENARDLTLLGDWLYFFHNDILYKIKGDGKQLLSLGVNGTTIQYYDKALYYMAYDGDIILQKKFCLVDGKEQMICNDFKIKHSGDYFVDAGYIFYMSKEDSCIYKMDLDGKHINKIIDKKSFFSGTDFDLYNDVELRFVVNNNKIFLSGNKEIRVFDTSGTLTRIIHVDEWWYGNTISGFADDYIYYWQDIPETGGVFMRVRNDGTSREYLTLDTNGKFAELGSF